MSRRLVAAVLVASFAGVTIPVSIDGRQGPSPGDERGAHAALAWPGAQVGPVPESDARQPVPWRPVLLVHEEGRPPVPLVVEAARYEVTVSGFAARTRATLTFRNDLPRVLEGELVFPLPEGALVSGFALDVAGHMTDGVVVEAQRARVAFEAEVRKGIDPGLVEWVRGNNFRTRVWPLPARGRRTVRVDYVSPLADRAVDGGLDATYELPLRFGVPLEEFSLRVEVVRDDVAPVVRSGLGNVTFERWEDRYVAEATRRDVTPEDLVVALPRVPRQAVTVETTAGGDTWFAIDDFHAGPVAAANLLTTPRRIGVAWDASLSRDAADRERELGLLQAYLAALHEVEVDAVVFRDASEAPRRFVVRNGDASAVVGYLRAQPCDGATNLASLSLPDEVAYTLLFSDGLWSIGGAPSRPWGHPVYAMSASAQADHALLAWLAASSGGASFNLQRHSDADVLPRLGRPVYSLREVTAGAGVTDLEPRGVVPVTGRVTIAGRLTGDSARVRVKYGYPGGFGEVVRTFDVHRSDARRGSLAATRWAAQRVAALAIDQDTHRDELVRLGQRFSIVTPGTSLLVLETLEQYVEHGVTPPESLPDLRAAYARRVEATAQAEKVEKDRRLREVLAMWQRRVAWWSRKFEYDPAIRYGVVAGTVGAVPEGTARSVPPGVVGGVVGGIVEAPPPPPAPSAMPAGAPAEAATRGEDASAERPAGPTIAVAPWNPDTPYLRAIESAPAAAAYEAYLAQRSQFGDSPAFFLDCADLFARRGDRALAIRILTNVAELKLEDARLLRVLAHRLEQVDELDLAVEIFERVRRLRPEEPQSHRDLALALDRRAELRDASGSRLPPAALADRRRALDLLAEVAMGEWDRRFPEVQVIALEEANRIASRLERRAARADWPLDDRLRQLLDVDVRVVLTWDTDLTDMDLWVTEPSGQQCSYRSTLTLIGGAITRDFTGGLGPEVYAVRRAMPGAYRIQGNFYGSRAQTITGPTTVQAVVFTNYGRPDEQRRAMTLRLSGARDVVEIGTVSFGEEGVAPKK